MLRSQGLPGPVGMPEAKRKAWKSPGPSTGHGPARTLISSIGTEYIFIALSHLACGPLLQQSQEKNRSQSMKWRKLAERKKWAFEEQGF